MSKLIIDTNVLIYAFDIYSNFHASAIKVLQDPSYELFVPTKVISEFFAVCSKLDIQLVDTMNFYREIRRNTIILFPDKASLVNFEELVQKYQPRGNKVFDLEIVSTAITNGISQIVTANLSDFQEIDEITIIPLDRMGEENMQE